MADEARESRTCDKCGVADTHAHHVQYVALVHPGTGQSHDLSVTKHVQCCAEDGCEICATDLEHAQHLGDTSPSDAFTAYMQDKPDEHHRALFERHGIETPAYTVNLS